MDSKFVRKRCRSETSSADCNDGAAQAHHPQMLRGLRAEPFTSFDGCGVSTRGPAFEQRLESKPQAGPLPRPW